MQPRFKKHNAGNNEVCERKKVNSVHMAKGHGARNIGAIDMHRLIHARTRNMIHDYGKNYNE